MKIGSLTPAGAAIPDPNTNPGTAPTMPTNQPMAFKASTSIAVLFLGLRVIFIPVLVNYPSEIPIEVEGLQKPILEPFCPGECLGA